MPETRNVEPVNIHQHGAVTPQLAVLSDGYETFTALALSSGAATAIFTAAAANLRKLSKIEKLVITNPTAGAVTITVAYFEAASATVFTYYPATSLAAAGRLVFDEVLMQLEPLDELRVTGASGIHCFVSAREYLGNVKQ
jgi:hypothetical protein